MYVLIKQKKLTLGCCISSLPYYVLIVACILSIFLITSSSASEINISRSTLLQLALHLEAEDSEKQYEFSRIALFEMYDSYQYEFDRSFTHLPRSQKKRAKVRHWRYAIQSYLDTLSNYLYLMDSGVNLHFFISKQNKIFLLIGDVPVIISGPNPAADKQIESNIVEQFCLRYDCLEYFEKTHYATQDSISSNESLMVSNTFTSDDVSSEWSIAANQQTSLIYSNGLVFVFSDIKNRKVKERWANGINSELMLLVDDLKKIQDKAKVISWSALMIEPLSHTDTGYKLIVNNNNDYVKVSLPLLSGSPELFKTIIPWLKSYLEKKLNYRLLIKADKYLIHS